MTSDEITRQLKHRTATLSQIVFPDDPGMRKALAGAIQALLALAWAQGARDALVPDDLATTADAARLAAETIRAAQTRAL
jgi:hypothetical protein